ncbi:MAG TPA: cytochrome c biogenesis protein CcdA [Bacteroidales bacterium]|nr:cytochrome c biogenesis protein CcdA [Bacteroidales bacterium]
MKQLIVLIVVAFAFFKVDGQVLDPVKWTYSVQPLKDGTYSLVFTAKIENKWHLYSQDIPEGGPIATSFTFTSTPNYALVGKVQEKTKGEVKYDSSFDMNVKMFSREARFTQTIKANTPPPFSIKGTIEFMSCDDSRCLPPKQIDFEFKVSETNLAAAETKQIEETKTEIKDTTAQNTEASIKAEETNMQDTASSVNKEVQADSTSDAGADSSLWIFIIVAFGTGLASIFTPCVYPMIPMTVSFFMQGEDKRSSGIMNGIVFGLSIVFIYTMIGVIVAITQSGANLTSVISSHWIPNLIFALLFLVFAASFFGMFEIVLPGSLANKVDQKAEKGGVMGAFFMALTLVIVSFSCTGPFVGSILIKATQGATIEPIIGMFAFSVAFAIPFVIFAFSPTLMKKMVKSGSWLNAVKVVFAFILLAFSLKFLSNIDTTHHWGILTREVYLSIWIVIFALLGLYLLGKLKFAHDSEAGHVSVFRLILVIAAFSFSVYLVPGLFGAPLSGISSLLPPQSEGSVFTSSSNTLSNDQNALCGTPKYADFLHLPYGLKGYFDYNEGLACAKEKNKPVFLDIKGHTCANCKKMEATVWNDPRVLEKLRNDFVIIALYTDDRTELLQSEWVASASDGKMLKTMGAKNLDFEIARFGTNTQPLYAILHTSGDTLGKPVGLTDVETFLQFLEKGKRDFANRK